MVRGGTSVSFSETSTVRDSSIGGGGLLAESAGTSNDGRSGVVFRLDTFDVGGGVVRFRSAPVGTLPPHPIRLLPKHLPLGMEQQLPP